MPRVAVVAHAGKSFGGGLAELREVLAREGATDPLLYEVAKSRKAPKYARRALTRGAEVIFVWGGDGMVQRCIDAVAGTEAVLAILPAGTANLLAANLHVPADLAAAVRVGLHGDRRGLDTGSVNGEHFAVMAGAGFDASMIKQADRGMKDRLGRAAYLYTGARNLSARRVKAVIEVDGSAFSKAGSRVSWPATWARSSAESRRSVGPARRRVARPRCGHRRKRDAVGPDTGTGHAERG
jgi:diacylglycerol kinase family enzyme